jgi:DNA-binding LacI/PurR family transcriptional regulator
MAKLTISKLEQLASLTGFSLATVSRALSDHPSVKEQTKLRIWSVARDYNFPTYRYQSSRSSKSDGVIAAIIPRLPMRGAKLTDPFVQELLANISEAARERNCSLQISYSAPSTEEEFGMLIRSIRADGLVFIGQGLIHDSLQRLADRREDFVVWGARMPNQRYVTIGSDNLSGGRRITRHLLRLNRRKLLFLGDVTGPEMHERYRGFVLAHEEEEVPTDAARLVSTHLDIGHASGTIERLVLEKVDFDGIVGVNDVVALGAIQGLRRHGINVPEDVSVVGYDNIEFSKYTQPPLSTISQDSERGGQLIVSKLIDRRNHSFVSEVLPLDLIIRESCGTFNVSARPSFQLPTTSNVFSVNCK